jgi:hypothetical protein
MLSSLLPGLRELRAPFAAGVLWMLAAWIHWEPFIPTAADAEKMPGLASSFYRLHGVLPDVALGAAAGFIAYLIGSLSEALLSDRLRALFRVSLATENQILNPLTRLTVDALRRLARRTRTEIEAQLAPTGKSVADFLAVEREASLRREGEGMWRRALSRIQSTELVQMFFDKLGAERRRQQRQRRLIMRHAAAPPPEAMPERELAELAILDLDVVTTARLLGKDQELYSAIDRHRAEVEFRLGVIPPLFALFVTASLRLPQVWNSALVVSFGVAAAVGLYWDALKQQREANGLLVDAAAHRRVEFPSLERLRASAQHFREMAADEAAWRVEYEIARTVAFVAKLDSFSSSAESAARALDEALRRVTFFEPRLEPQIREAAQVVLAELKTTVDLWNQGVKGQLDPGWFQRGQTYQSHAGETFERFRTLVRQKGRITAAENAAASYRGAQGAGLPGG